MNFNRKAMVLAVGAALAAPAAYAQVTSKAGSEWEFYGKFWPEYAHISGDSRRAVRTARSAPSAADTGASPPENPEELPLRISYLGVRAGTAPRSGLKGIWRVGSLASV